MEDLRREFEGEPPEMSPEHEARPPQRPDKLPLSEGPDGLPMDQTKQSYSHVVSNSEAPSSTTAIPKSSSAGEVVAGNTHTRSAQFWAFPTFYVLDPVWQLLYPNPWAQGVQEMEATQQAYQDAPAQRPAQSRDDMDLARSQHGRDRDEELRIRREMEQLRMQLREANSRAEQAERAAEVLTQQLKSRSAEIKSDDAGNPTDTVASLRAENRGLKAELDEARSHIFSLQPYRKDLTPKEVGQDFDDLVNDITDWVTNFMDPILDDDDRIEEVLAAAKKRPADIQKLKRYVHTQGDLVHGCMFPETDIDILLAVVMRFLQDNIFQRILFGAMPDLVEAISFVEAQMQTNVEPKRDLFALRTWRAEALNAVICSPDYQRARHGRIRELTTELAALFKVFRKDKDWNKLCLACQDGIIKPAVRLHEKLLTSTHHFYLDLNTYVVWSGRQELEMSPDFIHDLPKLRCENILQNRKPFSLAKLDPRPSREQLYKDLTNVATVVPALYMRQVGKGDVIKEPTVVRPQQVLVAWGSEEKRDKFLVNGERTLMHHLCFSSSRERQERGQEGGGSSNVWAQWRNLQWA